MVSVELDEIMRLSDRILVMSERPGRIVDEHHGILVRDGLEAGPDGISALPATMDEADEALRISFRRIFGEAAPLEPGASAPISEA